MPTKRCQPSILNFMPALLGFPAAWSAEALFQNWTYMHASSQEQTNQDAKKRMLQRTSGRTSKQHTTNRRANNNTNKRANKQTNSRACKQTYKSCMHTLRILMKEKATHNGVRLLWTLHHQGIWIRTHRTRGNPTTWKLPPLACRC